MDQAVENSANGKMTSMVTVMLTVSVPVPVAKESEEERIEEREDRNQYAKLRKWINFCSTRRGGVGKECKCRN